MEYAKGVSITTAPGPLCCNQFTFSSPGIPSSFAVPVRHNVSVGKIIDRSGPALAVGASFPGVAPYSICKTGAPPGSPLYDSATRLPLPSPLIIIAREFPATQFSRSMISWIMALISGDRWSIPATPATGHAAGVQKTVSAVRARDVMSLRVLLKVCALSTASPCIARVVAEELTSSTWNCM